MDNETAASLFDPVESQPQPAPSQPRKWTLLTPSRFSDACKKFPNPPADLSKFQAPIDLTESPEKPNPQECVPNIKTEPVDTASQLGPLPSQFGPLPSQLDQDPQDFLGMDSPGMAPITTGVPDSYHALQASVAAVPGETSETPLFGPGNNGNSALADFANLLPDTGATLGEGAVGEEQATLGEGATIGKGASLGDAATVGETGATGGNQGAPKLPATNIREILPLPKTLTKAGVDEMVAGLINSIGDLSTPELADQKFQAPMDPLDKKEVEKWEEWVQAGCFMKSTLGKHFSNYLKHKPEEKKEYESRTREGSLAHA